MKKKMLPLVGWHASIRHFLISHDTPCSPPPSPLKIKKVALISPVPREIEDNAYAKFWENKVYYGRCANGESQFERKWFLLGWLHKSFQGQHLLRLSINFVVINKDLEKLQTQLY